MASPGITVRPIRQITGEAEFNEVFLDEVIVPVENVIGEVNSGTRALMVLLSAERTGLSMAGYAVLVSGLKEIATRVVSSGSRDLRAEFTRAWSSVAVQRLTAMRSVSNMHDPEGSFASASAAKLQNAKNSQALAALDLQTLGIEGVAYPEADGKTDFISKKFIRSPADSIGGGTSEVQKNTVAERVLGLPK
jgi:alkylation response protein AidB-like acyl-CoA dehydrogenase